MTPEQWEEYMRWLDACSDSTPGGCDKCDHRYRCREQFRKAENKCNFGPPEHVEYDGVRSLDNPCVEMQHTVGFRIRPVSIDTARGSVGLGTGERRKVYGLSHV